MSSEGSFNLGYMTEGAKKSTEAMNVDINGHNVTKKESQSSQTPMSSGDNLNPMADVLSADIITKPFSIAAGSAKIPHSKFNPFCKKSGLLNVLAKQAKVIKF